MHPVEDVVPGRLLPIVIYAKDQPQYRSLPAVVTDDGRAVTRWALSWKERLRVLWSGSVWLSLLAKPLYPAKLDTVCPITPETELVETT